MYDVRIYAILILYICQIVLEVMDYETDKSIQNRYV